VCEKLYNFFLIFIVVQYVKGLLGNEQHCVFNASVWIIAQGAWWTM